MKKHFHTLVTTVSATLLATPALAETAERSDKSSLMIWAFLGVCGLIVVAQVIPSLFSLRDTARQAKASKRGPVIAKSPAKH